MSSATIFVHNHETENCLDCDKLEGQIIDGKWKNYNIVLTNCLMQRFSEKTGETIEFHPFIIQLRKAIESKSKLIEEKVRQDRQRLIGKLSSNKLELETKVSKRKLRKIKVELEKLLETTIIEVEMIESEIRNTMDDCLRAPQIVLDQIHHIEQCSERTNDLSVRVKDLYDRLRAQNALLEAKNLQLRLILQSNKQSMRSEDS